MEGAAVNDQEFLEMCRLAAAPSSGGQWTDEKLDAVEAVKSDPTGVVSRLMAILSAAQAPQQVRVNRRLEDSYWSMQRENTRMFVEAGAPYLGDPNGVTVRLGYGAMGFAIELDVIYADAIGA